MAVETQLYHLDPVVFISGRVITLQYHCVTSRGKAS